MNISRVARRIRRSCARVFFFFNVSNECSTQARFMYRVSHSPPFSFLVLVCATAVRVRLLGLKPTLM